MGIETALAVSAVAAVASTGVAIANYESAKDAAGAQKTLADEQRARLASEQAASAALAKSQEATGSQFGYGEQAPKALATGFGFGTAPAGSPNSGRAQITGGL